MAEILDLGEFDDEDHRFLIAMANGMGKSVEDAAGEILATITRNQQAIQARVVACEVTDLALIRAKRGPKKASS